MGSAIRLDHALLHVSDGRLLGGAWIGDGESDSLLHRAGIHISRHSIWSYRWPHLHGAGDRREHFLHPRQRSSRRIDRPTSSGHDLRWRWNCEANASATPGTTSTVYSSVLSGLPNTPVAAGQATVNITYDAEIDVDTDVRNPGFATVTFQYSTDGSIWGTIRSTRSAVGSTSVSLQIPLTNLNQLQLRIQAIAHGSTTGGATAQGNITAWSAVAPTSGSPTNVTSVKAYRYYTAGDFVTYSGVSYVADQVDLGGTVQPGTDATIWSALPADLTYEVSNPYAAVDLFNIHYTQSGDVLTLVHPNYPPAELRRLGALQWQYQVINFGQASPRRPE
jgi:hypothetical protein